MGNCQIYFQIKPSAFASSAASHVFTCTPLVMAFTGTWSSLISMDTLDWRAIDYFDGVTFQSPPLEILRVFDLLDLGYDTRYYLTHPAPDQPPPSPVLAILEGPPSRGANETLLVVGRAGDLDELADLVARLSADG